MLKKELSPLFHVAVKKDYMELYQIRTFVAVAEERHLTRASERLNTSQPSVSAHIKALEEEFGLPLFIRSRKGMALTDEGTLMLEKAKNVLASTGELLTHAENLRGELIGKVRIGVNTDPEVLKITDFFKEMKNSYPKLRLKLIQSSSSRVLKYLRTEEFDGGYILGDNSYPEINTISLHCLHLVVAGPASWESKIRNAGKEEIARFPWVIHTEGCPFDKIIRDNFGERNQIICRAVEADDETMKSLIYAGAGLGLMYRCEALAAQNEGKVAVWDGNTIKTNLSFAYLKKKQNDPKIQAMLKTLRKIWKIPDYCCQA